MRAESSLRSLRLASSQESEENKKVVVSSRRAACYPPCTGEWPPLSSALQLLCTAHTPGRLLRI
eukprot:764850-Hanusia_phi.AAC.2